jgi:hypothetical protein
MEIVRKQAARANTERVSLAALNLQSRLCDPQGEKMAHSSVVEKSSLPCTSTTPPRDTLLATKQLR